MQSKYPKGLGYVQLTPLTLKEADSGEWSLPSSSSAVSFLQIQEFALTDAAALSNNSNSTTAASWMSPFLFSHLVLQGGRQLPSTASTCSTLMPAISRYLFSPPPYQLFDILLYNEAVESSVATTPPGPPIYRDADRRKQLQWRRDSIAEIFRIALQSLCIMLDRRLTTAFSASTTLMPRCLSDMAADIEDAISRILPVAAIHGLSLATTLTLISSSLTSSPLVMPLQMRWTLLEEEEEEEDDEYEEDYAERRIASRESTIRQLQSHWISLLQRTDPSMTSRICGAAAATLLFESTQAGGHGKAKAELLSMLHDVYNVAAVAFFGSPSPSSSLQYHFRPLTAAQDVLVRRITVLHHLCQLIAAQPWQLPSYSTTHGVAEDEQELLLHHLSLWIAFLFSLRPPTPSRLAAMMSTALDIFQSSHASHPRRQQKQKPSLLIGLSIAEWLGGMAVYLTHRIVESVIQHQLPSHCFLPFGNAGAAERQWYKDAMIHLRWGREPQHQQELEHRQRYSRRATKPPLVQLSLSAWLSFATTAPSAQHWSPWLTSAAGNDIEPDFLTTATPAASMAGLHFFEALVAHFPQLHRDTETTLLGLLHCLHLHYERRMESPTAAAAVTRAAPALSHRLFSPPPAVSLCRLHLTTKLQRARDSLQQRVFHRDRRRRHFNGGISSGGVAAICSFYAIDFLAFCGAMARRSRLLQCYSCSHDEESKSSTAAADAAEVEPTEWHWPHCLSLLDAAPSSMGVLSRCLLAALSLGFSLIDMDTQNSMSNSSNIRGWRSRSSDLTSSTHAVTAAAPLQLEHQWLIYYSSKRHALYLVDWISVQRLAALAASLQMPCRYTSEADKDERDKDDVQHLYGSQRDSGGNRRCSTAVAVVLQSFLQCRASCLLIHHLRCDAVNVEPRLLAAHTTPISRREMERVMNAGAPAEEVRETSPLSVRSSTTGRTTSAGWSLEEEVLSVTDDTHLSISDGDADTLAPEKEKDEEESDGNDAANHYISARQTLLNTLLILETRERHLHSREAERDIAYLIALDESWRRRGISAAEVAQRHVLSASFAERELALTTSIKALEVSHWYISACSRIVKDESFHRQNLAAVLMLQRDELLARWRQLTLPQAVVHIHLASMAVQMVQVVSAREKAAPSRQGLTTEKLHRCLREAKVSSASPVPKAKQQSDGRHLYNSPWRSKAMSSLIETQQRFLGWQVSPSQRPSCMPRRSPLPLQQVKHETLSQSSPRQQLYRSHPAGDMDGVPIISISLRDEDVK